MQIVTDRGADLTPEQLEGLKIYYVPLRISLDGKNYDSGVDLQPIEFYDMLTRTDSFPTTSQPSAGDFARLYRELAKTDPEILSIHISSGLSGTLNAAQAGAQMTPEAKVTFFDTKTLSVPEGWHVQAAALALKAGWPLLRVFDLLERIREQSEGIFTINTLKYLIHGGRISHLKGLLASIMNIKPIIGVGKTDGKYITLGQEVTLRRSIRKLAETIGQFYPQGTPLRVQLLHGNNLEGVELLRHHMEQLYDCFFEPTTAIAPVLGAHTGPGLVGLSVGPRAVFSEVLQEEINRM